MISRRDFLKGAGVATLAVAATGMLAGCSVPNNTPAPAPSEPETPAASNTVTLADGVTLTILGTVREKAGVFDYLAVKFKLNNESDKNVTITENNFKANLRGQWVFPIAAEELTNAQKQFLLNKADAPYIGYYGEVHKPEKKDDLDGDMMVDDTQVGDDDMMQPNGGFAFGTAGTELEAAVCFQAKTTETKMDLVVTYGGKVFKFNLAI